MDVLIADLYEDASALGEQLASDREPISQIAEIAVDAVLPGVAERPDLFRLASDLVELPVADLAVLRRHLTSSSRS